MHIPRQPQSALAGAWGIIAPVAITAVVALIGEFSSASLQQTIITALVDVVLTVGLYIFVGNSGIVSFGHATFMAIGAYLSGLLTIPVFVKASQFPHLPKLLASTQMSGVPGVIIPAAVAALIALLIAGPIMRLVGLAASIATFAVLLISQVVLVQVGSTTFVGLPLDMTLWSAFGWVAVAVVLAGLFQRSRFGYRLKASRDDEFAARAAGIDVTRERTIAFMLSAFVVGMGGALYGHLEGAFGPDSFYLSASFLMIVMLVTGGINSLAGAVIGSLVVSAIAEGLREIENGLNLGVVRIPARPGVSEVGLGILLVVILKFRPQGIMGGHEIAWPFTRREHRGAEAGNALAIGATHMPETEATAASPVSPADA